MVRVPANIHEVPFVRLVIPLTAGILIQRYLNLTNANLSIIGILVLLLLLVFTRIYIKSWEKRWIFGLILNLLLILFGCLQVTLNSPETPLKPNTSYNMLVRLTEPPTTGSNAVKVKAEIIDAKGASDFNTPKPMLLYFSVSDSACYSLGYGDILAVSAKLREFAAPPNPYQFDMKQYMYLLGIVYNARVNQGCWEKIGTNPKKIFSLAYNAQAYVIETLKQYGIEGQELAVISALLLGYKSLLDDEIRQVYSSVGAMHILAVSGLHVGLVFGVVVIIISFLPKRRYWLGIRLGIAIVVLWGYALLTGLSPSVCRATIMFSLFAIGQTAGLKTNSYNTLAAAAFVLLVTNPFMLFNVGFQLSFAAVLSIVFFHPIIYNVFNPKNRLLDYVWSLIAVSAAAQILTLPISLYNFGQFPVIFLITNLMAIPLATVVLYLSLITVTFSFIKPLGLILAKVLGFSTWLLNSGLKIIETFPYSNINSICFSAWQALLLLLSILMFSVFLVNRKYAFLQLTFVSLFGVMALWAFYLIGVKNKSELVVFALPKSSAICMNSGGKSLIIYYDSVNIKNAASGYLRYRSLEKPKEANLNQLNGSEIPDQVRIIRKSGLAIIITSNHSMALAYNDSVKNINSNYPFKVDMLLANRYCSSNLFRVLKPQKVIIDPSVSVPQTNRLISNLMKENVAFHNMHSSGFFEYILQDVNPKTIAVQ